MQGWGRRKRQRNYRRARQGRRTPKTEAASLVKEWVGKAEESTRDLDTKVKDAIANAFEKLNIPSRDAIEKLEKKVQNLSAKIDKLEGGKGEGGA